MTRRMHLAERKKQTSETTIEESTVESTDIYNNDKMNIINRSTKSVKSAEDRVAHLETEITRELNVVISSDDDVKNRERTERISSMETSFLAHYRIDLRPV